MGNRWLLAPAAGGGWHHCRVRVGAAAALLVLCWPGAGATAEWTVDFFARERLLYDDNVGFTQTVDVGGGTEVLDLTLLSRFDFTYFADESDLDSNDQRLAGIADYRAGELMRFGLAVDYVRDTTRTSELDDTGLFIFDNIRREAFEIRPIWSFDATRIDRFSLEGEYRTVDYERSLVDYDRYGGAIGWERELTRASTLGASAFGARVESDTVDNRESDVYGGEIGIAAEAAPRLDVRFGVGFFRAETSTDLVAAQSDSGFLPSAGFSFRIAPEAVLDLSYARTVAASGGGGIVERDTIDLSFEQRFSETVTLGLDARYRTQDRVFDDGTPGREFFRAEPSVAWSITETWSLRAAYRYRQQSFDGQPDDAVSNAGLLTLTYRPLALSLGG